MNDSHKPIYAMIRRSHGVKPMTEWSDVPALLQSRITKAFNSWILDADSLLGPASYRTVQCWSSDYVLSYLDDIEHDYNPDSEYAHLFYPEPKSHFAYLNRELINEEIDKRAHKRLFKSQIAEELIAEAMHPCRLMARMQICDDIEQFFDAC